MTFLDVLCGGTRSEISSSGKSEIDAVLEVIIGGGDETLEFNVTRDEGARSRGFGCLAKGVGIYNALDAIDGGCEEFAVTFDCR